MDDLFSRSVPSEFDSRDEVGIRGNEDRAIEHVVNCEPDEIHPAPARRAGRAIAEPSLTPRPAGAISPVLPVEVIP